MDGANRLMRGLLTGGVLLSGPACVDGAPSAFPCAETRDCTSGFTCVESTCVDDATAARLLAGGDDAGILLRDAGEDTPPVDAGGAGDAGSGDGGTPPGTVDGGGGDGDPADAGTPAVDGGTPPPVDGGTTSDGGAGLGDAGLADDAGAPGNDGGAVDAGPAADGGAVDAGASDAGGPPPDPWWNTDWPHRARVGFDLTVIDADGVLDRPLDPIVALVRVPPEVATSLGCAADLADARFATREGTLLASSTTAIRDTGGNVVGQWVKTPELGPTVDNAYVYLYCGAANPGTVTPSSPYTDYAAALHLEGSNGVNDSARTDLTTTVNGSPTTVAGPFGRALSFDGNDHLSLPAESRFDFTTNFSVEAWFRVTTFDQDWQALVTKGDQSWRIHRYGGSSPIAFGTNRSSDENADDLATSSNVNNGNWHQVVVTYDGARKRIFLDGVLSADRAYTHTLNTTNDPVMIGNNSDHTDRDWKGSIDEVRIRSGVMNPAQIAASFANGTRTLVVVDTDVETW